MYYASKDDDWESEKLWHKVSPALWDFVSLDEYREHYAIAREIPSRRKTFQQLHLNMPVDEGAKWLDMSRWDSCRASFDPKELEGKECFAALDLAPVRDLTALCLLFPMEDGKLRVLPVTWCNCDDIIERSRVERVPYDVWADSGAIRTTPGASTDFDVVRRDINELGKLYRIKQLAIDPAHGYQLGHDLLKDGFRVEWFRQGFLSFGPPTARTEKLILDGTLQHLANPVLDYCLSNVVCEIDAAGNQKPSNRLRKQEDRIDAAVSLIMSVGLWTASEVQPKESMYERRARERAAAKQAESVILPA